MDEDGYAHFSAVENLAARARVTVEECNAAVTVLSNPDSNSADPEFEGRRIERVQGGFVVLNAPKYRAIASNANRRESTRLRVKRFREEKDVTLCNASVTPVTSPSEYASEYASASDPDGDDEYLDVSAGIPTGQKLTDRPCDYCGISEIDAGRSHQIEHFLPQCLNGGDRKENLLRVCVTCNSAKQGRLFETVADCRAYLHWRYWSSARVRYARHREKAFEGKPPDPETISMGLKLHTTTVAQPQNSKRLGTATKKSPVELPLEFRPESWPLLIYDAYPKKVAKPEALKAITKAIRTHKPEFVMEKTKAYAAVSKDLDYQFIPHPSTWFNQERFNDHPETWKSNANRQQTRNGPDAPNPRNFGIAGDAVEHKKRFLAEVARRTGNPAPNGLAAPQPPPASHPPENTGGG